MKVQTANKAAKKGSSTTSPTTVMAPIQTAYNSRNDDLDLWRNNNKKEGFVCINVNGLAESSTKDKIIKELKKLDEKANPSDKETKRTKKARKPIFRFISSKDGKAKGGGFFLYSGYRDGVPLYFRAKSLIPNSSVQNFSIQWCNVLELWIKWLDTESEQNSIIANNGNTRLVISYTR